MTVLAFAIVAFMFATYVVLDGYDLGVAAISGIVARSSAERRATMRSIGPFWNGNEVWLIAGGATLFATFPKAFASAFSGFYLPLIVLLWLLMGRGIAMELRDHYKGELWHQFWDTAFCMSSALLILVLGVALGNLLRGVPLDPNGYFRGTFTFLLNPYAIGVGVFALVALTLHGATFLMLRVEGALLERTSRAVPWLWLATSALFVIVTVVTMAMRRDILGHVGVLASGALAFGSLATMRVGIARASAVLSFGASSAFLAALLAAAAMTMYPFLLRDYPSSGTGISIFAAAPSATALVSAVVVTVIGLVAVIAYTAFLWPRLAGKVKLEE